MFQVAAYVMLDKAGKGVLHNFVHHINMFERSNNNEIYSRFYEL